MAVSLCKPGPLYDNLVGHLASLTTFSTPIVSQSKGDAVHFNDVLSGRRWSYSGSMMPAPVISDYAYSGYYGRLAVTFKSVQPQPQGKSLSCH